MGIQTALLFLTLLPPVRACVKLKGIEFDCPSGSKFCLPVSAFDGIPLNDPSFSVFGTAVGTILQVTPGGLYGYETPIQNHLASSVMTPIYGAAAAFHDTALELFGRKHISEERRRCKASGDEEEQLWKLHRTATLLYTVFWSMSEILTWKQPAGGAATVLNKILEQWNIDPNICTNGTVENCDDVATPWGLARTMIDEIHDFMKRDGWNHMGDLPDVSYNKVPYVDWRSSYWRYAPKNTPWSLTDKRRWQPLLEHNQQGFMFHQEHVVPHIGDTARSIFLTDEEICDRDLEDPEYDLNLESNLVLQRTRDLTEFQKVEIEYFDNKLASLFPLLVQQYVRMGYNLDSFEFIVADAANLHALREATIVIWRQKVKHDLVRPTSYIHSRMVGQYVTSYGGPDSVSLKEGNGSGGVNIKTEEWQPYIRVMPHAEFPSGSSCFCRAFADTVVLLNGSDDLTNLIGGPLMDSRPAGSSKIEKGFPVEDVNLSYNSWEEIVQRCGDTRLEGGMHFTSSVQRGEDVCAGIGNVVVDAFKKLEQGEAPGYIVDYDASNISESRCPMNILGRERVEGATADSSSEEEVIEEVKDDDDNHFNISNVLALLFGQLFVLSLTIICYLIIVYIPKRVAQIKEGFSKDSPSIPDTSSDNHSLTTEGNV